MIHATTAEAPPFLLATAARGERCKQNLEDRASVTGAGRRAQRARFRNCILDACFISLFVASARGPTSVEPNLAL